MLEVSEGVSVFDELCRVLRGTLVMGDSKNLKLKTLCIFTVFPALVNKIATRITVNESDQIMGVLEQAFQIEWGGRDENFKHHLMLAK
jgi:hypothetical protein